MSLGVCLSLSLSLSLLKKKKKTDLGEESFILIVKGIDLLVGLIVLIVGTV